MPAPDASTGDRAPLDDALDKNKAAQQSVQEAAEDLAVVHTVLDTEMPPPGRSDQLDQAVAQTEQLQKKLDETAEVLREVNQALESQAGAGQAKGSRS